MGNDLTKDEVDALRQIDRKEHQGRPSACVARNAKRLTGLKFLEYKRAGQLALTDKGRQTLFIYRCLDTLRGMSLGEEVDVDPDVAAFLCRKGHIEQKESGARFVITRRGSESLADSDIQSR